MVEAIIIIFLGLFLLVYVAFSIWDASTGGLAKATYTNEELDKTRLLYKAKFWVGKRRQKKTCEESVRDFINNRILCGLAEGKNLEIFVLKKGWVQVYYEVYHPED